MWSNLGRLMLCCHVLLFLVSDETIDLRDNPISRIVNKDKRQEVFFNRRRFVALKRKSPSRHQIEDYICSQSIVRSKKHLHITSEMIPIHCFNSGKIILKIYLGVLVNL